MCLSLSSLKCEYRTDPIGLSTPKPRFSWRSPCGLKQTAYLITVTDTKGNTVWNSEKVISDTCFSVRYGGEKLRPCTAYNWTVTVWYENSDVLSASSCFETGFFSLSDWKAKWITAKGGDGPIHARTVFSLPDKAVSSARLYSATTTGAFGNLTFCVNDVYLTLNGKKVGDDIISPGQISEKKWRALYRTYDVTDMLTTGDNAVGAVLLSMAYSLILRVVFADEEELSFDLSDSFKVNGSGPYRLWEEGVEDQAGKMEDYNALKEYSGFDMPGFDDTAWKTPCFTECVTVLAEQTVTAKVIEELSPVSITQKGWIHHIIDFGQVINGHIKIVLKAPPRGKRISVLYAEALTPGGELDPVSTMNYMRGENSPHTDTYIPKGDAIEVFEPRFANHSFRYVDIIGLPFDMDAQNITAQVVHSPVLSDSYFSCDDGDINALYKISRWSQRDNLFTVPTDCPSRERHGWLGDALVVCESECVNFDLLTFYESWCRSISDDQADTGNIQYITPYQYPYIGDKIDIPWSSACTLIPWFVYETYGDSSILYQTYPTIEKWIDFMAGMCDENGLISGSVTWNDHTGIKMDTVWLGTLYFLWCLDTARKICGVIGENGERFASLWQKSRMSLRKRFKNESGFSDGSQSDLAHALALGLCEPDEVQPITDMLVGKLEDNGYILTCGCLGIYHLINVLSAHGRHDVIYKLCKVSDDGSFLGWVKNHDATTAFEFLRFNEGFSRNHPFLMGSVTSWFYEGLAGIRKTSPGYKTFDVSPYIEETTGISSCIETLYGNIELSVKKSGKTVSYSLTVPCGTSARLYFIGRPQNSDTVRTDDLGRSYIPLPGGQYEIETVL